MKYTLFILILIGLVIRCSNRELTEKGNDMPLKYDFQNPALDRETRVNDLLQQMTIEEKISQLTNESAAIPRLGIPAYNWWNEALHGVARAGDATVFPQAIGLAATWNTDKIHQMADVISTEARAKHHEAVRNKEFGIYQGLTFWSPNINIFRDPRWGRGQETYGEDPFLTARIGVAFVKGIQGDHPKYLKAAACAKHFAVHSGPEHLRHEFEAVTSPRDFRETYMPAFKTLIQEADVEAVMCAYNRYDGKACCGSDYLLTELIRDQWGFDGHVVSDCGALWDILNFHKLTASRAETAALGLKSGTDLNCGSMFRYLGQAYEQQLVTEMDIDRALRRLLNTRFKLGMFDPPEKVAFAQIPYEKVDAPEHRKLALEMARESIVLLKNADHTLPLSKNLKKVAVIGPNADSFDALLGNYNGTPVSYSTPLTGIRNTVSSATEVTYAMGVNYTGESVLLTTIPSGVLFHEGNPGLQAAYFDNMNLEGKPFKSRIDEQVDFNWSQGNPVPGLPTDGISARWTGELKPQKSGDYVIAVTGDDGYRLWFDNELVMDVWKDQGATTTTLKTAVEAGRSYPLKLEYYENGGDAVVQLSWQEPGIDMREQAMQAIEGAEAIIFVGGISPRFEGEEMGEQAQFDGFFRGDRTKIALPEAQTEMLKELHATGKPVVLVILGGSAITVNWEDQNLPAILHAWYPGQAGGQAVADVLFGNYNPAGRLPVTVYKSENQLPAYDNYYMDGRTYRYFKGDPLYPFGFGLSFSSFVYIRLETDKKEYTAGEIIGLRVGLANTGKYDGDEVVQVYIRHKDAVEDMPIRQLKAFKRLHLNQGETETITLFIPVSEFSFYDEHSDDLAIKPGTYELQIGASSRNIRLTTDIGILP